MNRNDIIRMAREAGLLPENSHPTLETRYTIRKEAAVQRFAALVAAKEREACAQVCDSLASGTLAGQVGCYDELSNLMLRQVAVLGHGECAAAIRARSAT